MSSNLTLRLKDSTVTGNGLIDIVSQIRPSLKNTTCGTSGEFQMQPWGVCAND